MEENERVSSDQLHQQSQKWKQGEEEFCRKIMELEAELGSSVELRQQLQRKVQFLENENYVLQTKHTELKETINSILQAKQGFVKAYQESTCEMKRSIESRDKKIGMLSEKINVHLLSLDSIRKEAYSVKQVVDNAQRVVDEKEEVGIDLEAKLQSNKKEFHRKDRLIAELQAQLETAKITDQCPSKIALLSELGMLEVSFKIVQDTMTCMDEEDRVAYSLIMLNQEKDATEKDREDGRINHQIENSEANSLHGMTGIFLLVLFILRKSTFSPSSSIHSESQPAVNASNVPVTEDKEHLDNDISIEGNNFSSKA
ncbi:hypothetical protein L1987_79562 [Smallanthus sonchifolius]|uniref:Uncharacterized protein n=1 Tax=Smallanthus sonchifolius TaxID=185202 RepID=A0ACB8ZFR8_9ASTR|nr:hypothetical protein L1987_79562 [Smallanthus sonchifolius]